MMPSKILEYLEQLDLSETEALLYLKLLETGPISLRDLAQTTGLKRTTAYLHVDLLVEKGLVMKIVKGSQKQVAANPPAESIEFLVKSKLETATMMNTQFPTMLQELTKSIPQGKDVGNAEIKYYKGKSGVRKIYEEAFSSPKIRSYANPTIISQFMPENNEVFTLGVNKNPTIELYEIFDGSEPSYNQVQGFVKDLNEANRYKYKFLPPTVVLSAADILIYDGKVSIINAREKTSGVVLTNKDFYKSSLELFDFIWQILPEA